MLAKAHRAMAEFVEKSVQDQHLCLSDFMVLEALLHRGLLFFPPAGRRGLGEEGEIYYVCGAADWSRAGSV